jgi:hypothetical protein
MRLGRVGFDRVAGQLADLHAVLADRPDLVEACGVPELSRRL